jgi:hypothetical protein
MEAEELEQEREQVLMSLLPRRAGVLVFLAHPFLLRTPLIPGKGYGPI